MMRIAVVSAPPLRADTPSVLPLRSAVFLISGWAIRTYGVPSAIAINCLASGALSWAGHAESGVAAAVLTEPPIRVLTALGELVVVSKSNSIPNLWARSCFSLPTVATLWQPFGLAYA